MPLPPVLLLKVHIKVMADGNAYSFWHPSDWDLTKGPESSWRAEGPSSTCCSVIGAQLTSTLNVFMSPNTCTSSLSALPQWHHLRNDPLWSQADQESLGWFTISRSRPSFPWETCLTAQAGPMLLLPQSTWSRCCPWGSFGGQSRMRPSTPMLPKL